MSEFTPYAGLIGGLMIGAAASLLVLLAGRIAGISGIVAGAFSARGLDQMWRIAFVAGLIAGPFAVTALTGQPVQVRVPAPAEGLILAGLLVGFGARLGSGCTSGHGVCGVARLSPRSIVATAVFVGVAMVTVFVLRHLMGVLTWP